MNKSRLPHEVCEQILDSCRVDADDRVLKKHSYPIWRQTALVCSAWLPRSRYNLLYEVELRKASDINLLVRTLQETPRFADLVVRLTVYSHFRNRYVPFGRMPLPLLLKNCKGLDLRYVDWTVYPPRYADTGLYHWSNIVELWLDVRFIVLRPILRFVSSSRQLRYLNLNWSGDLGPSNHSPVALAPMSWLDTKPGRCESLCTLVFRGDRCALGPWPAHAFGSSVKNLCLNVGDGISESTLQCIQTFHGLEQLDIPYAILDNAPSDPIRTVRSILSSVHSGSALRSLKINLYPARPEWTYIYTGWIARAFWTSSSGRRCWTSCLGSLCCVSSTCSSGKTTRSTMGGGGQRR
ncbi:hypothetical protein C8Q76DRAFT_68002 [Earliella scabrosa]|nr:hypothetical protein C8Q76DRAFT_68002 [Earliella scabrosa]